MKKCSNSNRYNKISVECRESTLVTISCRECFLATKTFVGGKAALNSSTNQNL